MNDFLIVGSGRTLLDNHDKILEFIGSRSLVTIGINNMTSMIVPDYHLWTNKKQFSRFGTSIKSPSKVLFGCGIPAKVIKRHYGGKYKVVQYKDADGIPLKITKEKITGRFRTAGTLAIAIAHSWNPVSKIFIVGMDGYTLHSKQKLKNKEEHHHCYGKGFTDDASWEKCVIKDRIVYGALKDLKKYGVDFCIITPTVFEDFYEKKY